MFGGRVNLADVTGGVRFADVVEAVMKSGLDDAAMVEGGGEAAPGQGGDEAEGDNAKNGLGKDGKVEKKPRQNKSYVTAKTLNDREERRLIIKLNHYQKELKQATYQIDVAQRAIRRELQSINPDLAVDPNKGFFIPKGMTREQAEMIKSKRRETQAAANTRSISLDEFTEMRKRKTEMGRQQLQAIQQDKPEEEEAGHTAGFKGRDRWKALSTVINSNPASFSQMAKVSAAGKTQAANQKPPSTAESAFRKVVNMNTALRGVTR